VAGNPLDSLLTELDQTIRNEEIYTQQKVSYIENLQFKLSAAFLTPEDQYLLYQQLAKEYGIFRCDTAIYYANQRLRLAEEIGNTDWIQESKFQLASMLAKACMFEKAIDLLRTVDQAVLAPHLQVLYYKTFRDTYIYYSEFYQEGYEIHEISRLRAAYQDSLLRVVPTPSFDYVLAYGTYYIETGEFDRAEELLLSYYERLRPDTRDFALLASILAYLAEKRRMSGSVRCIWHSLLLRISRLLIKKIFPSVFWRTCCFWTEILKEPMCILRKVWMMPISLTDVCVIPRLPWYSPLLMRPIRRSVCSSKKS